MKVASVLLVLCVLCAAGCQSGGKFTTEQIKGMKQEGFSQQGGDWSLGLSDRILFGINDSKLTAESKTSMHKMAANLAALGIRHLHIYGYTDNYGDAAYNQQLSLKRANTVAAQWAAGGGIPEENILTRGMGKNNPVASNHTRDGRAQNRRVAIIISSP